QKIRASLEKKGDPEALRMLRFLRMGDLSRTPGNPIAELVSRILKMPSFASFDTIKVPEIVPVDMSFDLFNFPPDHPARSASDSYFPEDGYVLRTHTTVMWYYYVKQPAIQERLRQQLPVACLAFGKVYRKDEIDRKHMNVFHQMDGWYLVPKSQKTITVKDLEGVLAEIAQALFGKDIKYRFNQDSFPYTDPSVEMEIDQDGKWIEVLGSGIVRPEVLEKLGVDSRIYNGWAFGFGLERLAILSMNLPDIRLLWSQDPRVQSQLTLGKAYVPVSKYPPVVRDISFVVGKGFVPNNYFDLIRDIGGDLVEEVQLLDTYEDKEKFGLDKVSYTYRVVYRSNERTLVSKEVDALQEKLYAQTAEQFSAKLR
ncbi:MAG: hypothetical protein Q8P12_07080, partial [bacterium]|nr:hypothetical protein [bacterium]